MHLETIVRTNISLEYHYEGVDDLKSYVNSAEVLAGIHKGANLTVYGRFNEFPNVTKDRLLQILTEAGIDTSETEYYYSPHQRQLEVVWYGRQLSLDV